MKSIFVLITTD